MPYTDDEIKISSNVPMPRERKAKGQYANTLLNMAVGDSFSTDSVDKADEVNYRCSLNSMARYYGLKITTRKVLEDNKWALRTWRIA